MMSAVVVLLAIVLAFGIGFVVGDAHGYVDGLRR